MIEIDGLEVALGAFRLQGLSLSVSEGKYAVLMGRTGSGKTTILEAICGLKPVRAGHIRLFGRDVTHLKPAERGIGFVPQDAALFPTMIVREQLAFALHLHGWTKSAIAERVAELAEWLGLAKLLDRRPQGLSGGEVQRVALGRALAVHPRILCLDEPLSALDDQTKEEMYELLKNVREVTGVTALHVTHSLVEARQLADVVIRLEDGVLHYE